MTLTVMSTDGNAPPTPFTITVPKHGKFEDLTQALSTACSLGVDETLLVTEVYCHYWNFTKTITGLHAMTLDQSYLLITKPFFLYFEL